MAVRSSQTIGAVAVCTVNLKISELGELAEITLGGGGGESELTDDNPGGELPFIGP